MTLTCEFDLHGLKVRWLVGV